MNDSPSTRSAPLRLPDRIRALVRGKGLLIGFLGPALLVLFVVNIAPVIYTTVTSLQNYYLPFPQQRAFTGLENYINILSDARFWNAARITGTYVSISLVFQLVLGVIIALLLIQQKRFVGLIRGVLLFPSLITPVAVAFLWRLLFSPSLGLLNYGLSQVGLGPFAWIYDPDFALASLVLVDVWQKTPLLALIIFTGLLSLPSEVTEAATVDGASPWQLFWRIKVPLLKPVIMVGVLFRVIDLAKEFDVIYILTGGGPGTATETLSLYTYTMGFGFLRMGYSSALGMVLFLMIMGLALLIMRWGEVDFD